MLSPFCMLMTHSVYVWSSVKLDATAGVAAPRVRAAVIVVMVFFIAFFFLFVCCHIVWACNTIIGGCSDFFNDFPDFFVYETMDRPFDRTMNRMIHCTVDSRNAGSTNESIIDGSSASTICSITDLLFHVVCHSFMI